MTANGRIVVNVEGMTWDDMRVLLSMQGGEPDMLALVDIFDRMIVGGAKAVPVMRTQEAVAAIVEAISAMAAPKNSVSGSTPTSGQAKKRRSST